MSFLRPMVVLLGVLLGSAELDRLSAQSIDVWIGTAARDGVFHAQFDEDTGKLTVPVKMNTLGGAGFLSLHPSLPRLYATARDGKRSGVASYVIEGRGAQSKLRQSAMVETGDGGAACVGVDRTGRVVMSAQYGGGSVSSYLLDASGDLASRVQVAEQGPGSGVVANRQKSAHPHWVGTSPNNRYLMVPDLGMDAVVVYRLDASTGKMEVHDTVACPPGGGPRHMKFHPNGRFAYVLNELTLTVSVFSYDDQVGKMTPIQEIDSLPDELKDRYLNSAAEIRFHPNQKFLYTSNRGHDSITVYQVDPDSGKLTLVEREHVRGSWPRNFNLSPSGRWLLAGGKDSNTISVFEVDGETGELTFIRKSIVNVPQPICIEFGPEAR